MACFDDCGFFYCGIISSSTSEVLQLSSAALLVKELSSCVGELWWSDLRYMCLFNMAELQPISSFAGGGGNTFSTTSLIEMLNYYSYRLL